jgi:hypothetical protein
MGVGSGRLALPLVVMVMVACAPTAVEGPAEGPSGPRAVEAGAALGFGPHASFVEIPDDPTLDLRATWTLEAWIKPANAAGAFQHVLSKWNGGGDASYTLEVNGGRLRVAVHDGVNPSQAEESRGLLQSGVWQHVAATFTRGVLRLYLDGRLDREVPGVLTPMNSTRPLSIGHEGPPFNGWQYTGLIDEVRVWRVVRSGAQLRAWKDRGLTGREAGLVEYWTFDEGAGQVAGDRSGARNAGRLGVSGGVEGSDPMWTGETAPLGP